MTRRLTIALLCVAAFLPSCKSIGDLEPTSRDSLPLQVGKCIVLVPAVVGIVCFELMAGGIRDRSETIQRNEELGHGETEYYRQIY